MVVRIRLQKPRITDPHRLNNLALGASLLMVPCALLAFTLTLWTISSDLGWTGEFFLVHGLFSHWQVWLCTAALLLFVSRLLDKCVCLNDTYALPEEQFPQKT
jgi:hypothetical protein